MFIQHLAVPVGKRRLSSMLGLLRSCTARCEASRAKEYCMHRAKLLAPALALASFGAMAEVAADELVTYSLPKGWIVERDGRVVTAIPSSRKYEQLVSITICSSAVNSGCVKSCEPSELKPNYFYFFSDQSGATYSESMRDDGFRVLRGIGSLDQAGSSWIAAEVLCGRLGVVYIGATSTRSKSDAASYLDELASTVHLVKTESNPLSK